MNAGRYTLKKERARRRRLRVRRRVRGVPERPRLTVSRSLRHLYAQVVDDVSGRTLLGLSSRIVTPEMIALAVEAKAEKAAGAKGEKKDDKKEDKKEEKKAGAKGERKIDKKAISRTLGLQVAARAKELGIELVVFDRDRYPYHGRIQQFAEGARKGGLKF
jgi:large subunit ribosomal protein L18